MASKKATAQNTVEPAFQVSEAEEQSIGGRRQSKPNPLEGEVLRSYHDGRKVLQVRTPDDEQANQATSFLRRDARENGLGVRIERKYTDDSVVVKFAAKDRQTVRYTSDDIREWAEEVGIGPIQGRIPKEVREKFKKAHGYLKDDSQEVSE